MKRVMKAAVSFLIAFAMGLVYMWFLLSFGWSVEEMSTVEKIVGIVYAIVMVPGYFKLTEVMKLR